MSAPARGRVFGTHPQRTDDPATLRWHALGIGLAQPDETVTAPLLDLVTEGVLASFDLDRDAVATTAADGRPWADIGQRVGAAVGRVVTAAMLSLTELDEPGRRRVLTGAAEQVLADLVGPVAAAHGGSVGLVGVTGSTVTVRLSGACNGCPAAGSTLYGRLEAELRRRVPWEVTVAAQR